jgi:hypothetical protein
MSLNKFATYRPLVRAYHEQKSDSWLLMASVYRRATEGCAVPSLDIGIQAV